MFTAALLTGAPKIETVWVSGWKDKPFMIHPYSGILFSHRE